ncbi:MAG: prolyl oligopeptidase family serine peptidase [Verrucomicrobiota bacterium]
MKTMRLLFVFTVLACAGAVHSFAQEKAKRPTVPPARVPEGVKAHRDLEYVANGHERHKLDLYVPEKADGPLPLLIWIHGGGWQNGSKDGCPPLRGGYTERGYAVASINYRLSGHATFPAQIEDCKAAIRWLRAHARQYNLDPQRFGVWGSSAGGHLVALVGTSGDVKEFDVGAHLDQSSRVQAVCDYYGPTDFTVFVTTPGYESHAGAQSPEAKLIGGAVMENKDKAARVNPITFVTKDDPPFLIVHGDKDPTVPLNQSQLLFAALKKAGVSARFHTIKGAGHGGPGFSQPEIETMVRDFFEARLKNKSSAIEAATSESTATANPQAPAAPPGTQRPGISFDAVLGRNDANKDGKLSRDEFPAGPQLFERLDANKDGFVTREEHERAFPGRAPAPQPQNNRSPPAEPKRSSALPASGLLYFASYQQRDNPAPASNPHLVGALFTIYWSDVEKQPGVFDWSALDRRIAVWTGAGKRVALRIMWSSSGNWPEPAAKHPTPQFVLAAGAVTVRSESSKTDIPLAWDPVYRKHAQRFLREVARKFDGDPNVLFIDVTPGAETNPYRFRRINVAEPGFKQRFLNAAASDGRKYSHELWLETVKQGVDDAKAAFAKSPLLVTLNVGSLDGPEQFRAIGDHCVSRGCYVGQNGLNARSYDTDSPRKTAFLEWSSQTQFYFETVDASGGNTGSLMDIMKAAERVGCDFLGVYSVDVLRGTRGQANFDPAYEEALAYGAKVIGKAEQTSAPTTPPVVAQVQPAAPTRAKGPASRAKADPEAEPEWVKQPIEGPNLLYRKFHSPMVKGEVSYLIYLPAEYEQNKGKRYPVVYWLHGRGGGQQGVPGFAQGFTDAIAAGKMPPVIVVYVNGLPTGGYTDSPDGKRPVESYIIKDLIPHIDATYRTLARREGRMIEGFSMGGSGAAKLGFKYPDLFGSISILAGALHDADSLGQRGETLESTYGGRERFDAQSNPWKLAERNAGQVRGRTPIRIAVGGKDGLRDRNRQYHELLEKLNLAHEFTIIEDAIHSPGPVYAGLGEKNWAFYQRAFAQVTGASATPAEKAETAAPRTAPSPSPAAPPDPAVNAPLGFHANGERWTYRDGGFAMSGILLKPEGKGPFPAVLISHGLGGSAESFGLNKAREFVKWGFVCIAPNYTHNARGAGQRPPGAPKDGTPQSSPAAKGPGRGQPQPASYGASEENIRRARTCLELVSKMPEVDAKRLVAYGHSMGGFVTIGLASASPDLLKAAAITGSGLAPRAGFPAPSVEAAEKVRTPFLILHGSVDPVVRPEQSASLKEVLDRNQVPNARRLFEGEGHPIDQTKREEVFTRIKDWFTRHGALKN